MNRSCCEIAMLAALAGPCTGAGAAVVRVTITGVVEWNQFSTGLLAPVRPNDAALLRFDLNSNQFVNSPNFPVRGYLVLPGSWRFQIGPAGDVPLASPAGGAFFVVRNNDPHIDGFIVSSEVETPVEVPVAIGVPNFGVVFERTFNGETTLPSLDILDALGSWGFEDLSVYGFQIQQGELITPLGIIYQSISITRCASVEVQPVPVSTCAAASFVVSAAGSGPLTFVWKRGGVAVNLADPRVHVTRSPDGRTSVLTINGALEADAGAYTCTVGNDCGAATSNPAELTVIAVAGDMNCDCALTNFDIDPFVQALIDPGAYIAAFPACNRLRADLDGDQALTNFDIDPFVACIVGGGCP